MDCARWGTGITQLISSIEAEMQLRGFGVDAIVSTSDLELAGSLKGRRDTTFVKPKALGIVLGIVPSTNV